MMAVDAADLQREVQALREENAALLEALRLAQRGSADLRGHLSKWNPDADQQGIFTQDWELRYFVLTGTLLKYYSSERDVSYSPRGVLELQGCSVEIELPIRSTGPFIFDILDSDSALLLRLSADRLDTAKAWLQTLAAVGLPVTGWERFRIAHFSQQYEGLGVAYAHMQSRHASVSRTGAAHADVSGFREVAASDESPRASREGSAQEGRPQGLRQRLASMGRALSFRTTYGPADSLNSSRSVTRAISTSHKAEGSRTDVDAAAAAEQAAVQAGEKVHGRVPTTPEEPPSVNLQLLKQLSAVSRTSSNGALMRTMSSRRWEKADLGDEIDQKDDTGAVQVHRLSSTTGSTPPVQSGPGGTAVLPGHTPVPGSTASAVRPSRTGSVAHQADPAAADTAAEQPQRTVMDGSTPVHVSVKDSVLTIQNEFKISRHEGLLNLGVVVLVATNIRLVMSNIFTYGLRVRLDPATLASVLQGLSSPDDKVTWLAVVGCTVFYVAALMIERLGVMLLQRENKMQTGLSKKDAGAAASSKQVASAADRHEWLLFLLNIVNIGASLLLPCGLVLFNKSTLLPASALTTISIVTCLKLATYAHCNTTLRQQARAAQAQQTAPQQGNSSADVSPFAAADVHPKTNDQAAVATAMAVDRVEVAYPNNLELKDVAYFALAPTLCYQLNFPRLPRRRPRMLARWLLLLLATLMLMSFMQVQFLMPLMESSLLPLRQSDMLRFTEKLLRLSVPNVAHWLALFYMLFHLWLNVLGELLLFGDRMFYKEWWNAATLGDYWKLWNLPVHKFMLRTIFFPLIRRKWSKFPAMLLVFFVSAVMHELAVAVPLRMLRGWAFWGMMLQVPLVSMTEYLRKRLKSDTLGNMIFWASFCVLGQPMCLVLYYHDWVLANMGVQGLAKTAAAAAAADAVSVVEADVFAVAAAAAP